MATKTKREQAIERLEKELSSDDLIEVVGLLTGMAKSLTTATGRLQKLNKKKNREDITLTELLDEMGLTKNSTHMYIGDVFSSDIERDFIFATLIKEKKVTYIGNYLFNGKKLKRPAAYECEDRHLRLDETFHDIKASTVKVTIEGVDFLLLPAFQRTQRYQIEWLPGVWVISPDEQKVSIPYVFLKEAASKYSPLRNRFVIVEEAPTGGAASYFVKPLKAKFSLGDVVLPNEISAECQLLTSMVSHFENYSEGKVPFRRNIMFYGTPGTGKTTAVNAVAKAVLKAKGTVIYAKSADFERTYDLASRLAPALVIIEDFDLLAPNREQYGVNPITASTLNVLDGLLSKEGVLTLVTTNLLEHVDDAAKRAGRIDRGFEFTYPTNEMKIQLIDIHLKHFNIQMEATNIYNALESVLKKKDITGAMIESIVRNAKQQAIASTEKEITIEHFQGAAGCRGVAPIGKLAPIGFEQ